MATVRGSLSTQNPVVELHFENTGGQVRVILPDSDVMAMPVEMAIAACRAFQHQILFNDQFRLLLHRLAEWITPRSDKIDDAYLTVRDSGLLFLVVQAGMQFDDAIEEALTELDLDVANDKDFYLISLAVHAIPKSSQGAIDSFVSNKMSLRYRFDAQRI